MHRFRVFQHLVYILVIAANLVSPALAGIQVQAATDIRMDALVLVNSASTEYTPGFQHLIQPNLDHFGIPYTVLDIALTPVDTTAGDYAVIIVGHRGLDTAGTSLDTTEQAILSAAVSAGTGLVNFDNNLSADGATPRYQFIQDVFTFGYDTSTSGSDVTFADPALSYIIARHTNGQTITTSTMSLAGITLPGDVTALATAATPSTSQPFVAITTYGTGRAVQFGSYDWISHAVKGPLFGLDDLFWRSIVWAARKPFVMQGLPPFVTMRMDDTSGPLWWIHAANDYGFVPWAGVFTNDIDTAEAIDLSGLVKSGKATTSIHAFDSGTFFYYDHNNSQNFDDTTMDSHYAEITGWFTDRDIPSGSYTTPHYYEIGSNAFTGLANWGVQSISTVMDPGQREDSSQWMMAGPFRLFETGNAYDRNQNIYYADYLPTQPDFFNCITEIRDVTGYEWLGNGRNSVAQATADGIEWLKRPLDSMAIADLFSHEYTFIGAMSEAEWRTTMQSITTAIAGYNPIYVSRDYACAYARAVHDSNIETGSTYDSDLNQITVNLNGSTDMETKFYTFTDVSGQIVQQLVNVPAFNGTTQVAYNLPGPLDHITVLPNPAEVIAGMTQQFTAVGYDSAGNPIQNLNFTWSLANGGGTLSSSGLFTAGITPGTFTNTVKAAFGSIYGEATVSVTQTSLDHFSFDAINNPKYTGVPFTITLRARDAFNNPVVTYNGTVALSVSAGTIQPATANLTNGVWTGLVTLTPLNTGVTVSAQDGSITGTSNSINIEALRECPCSIWDDTAGPAILNDTDNHPIEVGVKFRSYIDGYILGLRFYKGTLNTGTHTGHLWDGSGTMLAEATFTNETASGWQSVYFDTPVQINAGTTYVASYFSPGGYISVTDYGLLTSVDNPPLYILAGSTDGPNGVFRYDTPGFPTTSWEGHSPNYWVDVIFDSQPQVFSIWEAGSISGSPSQDDPNPIEVGFKFKSDVPGSVIGLAFYKGTTNTGPFQGHLWDMTGTMLATQEYVNNTPDAGWQDIHFETPVPIDANTTYVASYFTQSGNYAAANDYFLSEVYNAPLRALANSESQNGVYNYGSSGFPQSSFRSSNYWVDVLFTPDTPLDLTSPVVATTAPVNNQVDVATSLNIQATFSESMDAASINASTYELRDGSGSLVPATVTYTAGTRTAVLDPASLLVNSTTYTATIKGGTSGVADSTGNRLAADHAWSFTTAAPPPIPPDDGPGGPILVISSAANPFTRYYTEILRTEGFNEFLAVDISSIDSNVLSTYQLAILGEMALTPAQVNMLADWVTAGGNLIAMRPDPQLARLLGLTIAGGMLSNGYILVNTATAPGSGIVAETIQFHDTADHYTLDGATAIAMLYSDATTGTTYPAVTLVSVGSNGGQAAAFTYDLAKSIVYTRQGNPAWVNINGDGSAGPVRGDDLFHNGSDPDWVNLNKVAIPQADEQQRLLANLIIHTNRDRLPLPRFWYFPRGEKAVVLMTADDHASSNVAGRIEQYKSASPIGCSVNDWGCIRSSFYVYPGSSLTEAQAIDYTAEGFEIGVHIDTGCANYTLSELQSLYSSQLVEFTTRFPTLPLQASERTHCIAWSGWAHQADVKEQMGIRLDTNYYYWPAAWINDQPGLFTGSGIPMRFADLDGSLFDVYQATTQMTDESGQSYPYTIDSLLDRALGDEGYYGVFTANMHSDSLNSGGSNAIIASAANRGVPVISGRQLTTWLDGRNASSFGSLQWSSNQLSFSISVSAGANGLQVMLPTQSSGGTISEINLGGSPVAYTQQVIKGVSYAVFNAQAGEYTASYTEDTTAPVITAVYPTDGAADIATGVVVAATLNEPMDASTVNASTFELRDPANNLVAAAISYDGATNTASLSPNAVLAANTTFTATLKGGSSGVANSSGLPLTSDVAWSFTTASDNCPCSIWDSAATPVSSGVTDGVSIEVGTKFRSASAGYITALRYYKGAADTDTHVGRLWTSNGTKLAEVTFSGGTSSGWQEMPLPTPVAIAANTTYVASIFTSPVGYFSITLNGLASAVSNPPLQALASGTDGPNGVYRLGGGFPSDGTNHNYWVDIVFQTSLPSDTTPPEISAVTATPTSTGTATTITWTTDEPASSRLDYGTSSGSLTLNVVDAAQVTSHSLDLIGLLPSTTYYYQVTSVDASGNSATSEEYTFTTPAPALIDTSVADFSLGAPGACAIDETIGDGALRLPLTLDESFVGPALPEGWSFQVWTAGGASTVSGGAINVDGARVAPDMFYSPGHSLEFVATFGSETFKNIGFGQTLETMAEYWAMFGIGNSANGLYARVNRNGSASETFLGNYLGTSHRYRIDWTLDQVLFFIDGSLVHTDTAAITANMRPVISDYQAGGAIVTVDWMHLTPYLSPCTFYSRVFDAGSTVNWHSLDWTAGAPAGANLAIAYRMGNSSTPDSTWTSFIALPGSGSPLAGSTRYAQYRVELSTSDPSTTPDIQDVRFNYTTGSDTAAPMILNRDPSPDGEDIAVEKIITITFNELLDPGTVDGSTFSLRLLGSPAGIPLEVALAGNVVSLTPAELLEKSTTYTVTVAQAVADLAGNPLGMDISWNFSTLHDSISDTTVADFNLGAQGVCMVDETIGDGAVRLPFTTEENFTGDSLPAGWSQGTWNTGGTVIVSGGWLIVDGAHAYSTQSYGVGASLEFRATFSSATYQNLGFSADGDFNDPWVVIGQGSTPGGVYARSNNGSSILLSTTAIDTPHIYRIDWKPAGFDFYLDGAYVTTIAQSVSGSMVVQASDVSAGGGTLSADWMRVAPYASPCTFTSRSIDAGARVDWMKLSWAGTAPAGTTVGFETRSGNSATPGGTWSSWEPVSSGGTITNPNSQYVQYRATLTTTDGAQTPVVESVSITYASEPTLTHSIALAKGWNLASFRVHPLNTEVSAVLASIAGKFDLVYAWDASNEQNPWMKYDNVPGPTDSLTTLTETMGFWIHMTEAATLTVIGTAPETSSIPLFTGSGGWNLVGYPSEAGAALPEALSEYGVGSDYTQVYAYHPMDPEDPWKIYDRTAPGWANDLLEFTSGHGYWIEVSVAHNWMVTYVEN